MSATYKDSPFFMLALVQDLIPASAVGEGLLAWPVSFIVICLGLAVILGGLEGPTQVKIGSFSLIIIMAILALYRVVWFSTFCDESVNAVWNYSLVPIGAGSLGYYILTAFQKWITFIKSKNHGVA